MPHKHQWQSRIKSVEREYAVMRQAADRLAVTTLDDPNTIESSSIFHGKLRYRDIDEASNNLEATYVIRLFAEFESGARQFWSTIRPSKPQAVDLIAGLAARRGVPDTQRDNADSVREHRNVLVHEREEDTEPMPISVARSHLCHFFSFLPERW